MKKICFLLILLVSLVLIACKNEDIKINLQYNNNNNQYELITEEKVINLSDYITYSKEYKIIYLEQEYSSYNNPLFNLQNGNNIFTINTESNQYSILIFKEYDCKVTIINNNLEEIDILTFKYNTVLTLDIFNKYNKEGYTLLNSIEVSSDKETFETKKIDEVILDKDIYIKLMYIGNYNEITLSIDGQEQKLNIQTGEKLNLPTPSKEGYNFLGWYSNNTLITNETIYEPSLGTKFEAKFSENTYNIIYKYFDEQNVISYKYNQEITEFIPEIEGYEFDGWYLNDNLFEETKFIFNENITLVAKYKIKEFTITYTNIDSIKTQTVKYNEEITLYLPIKEGYIFKYWEYNGQEFNINKYNLLQDIELVAVWEKEEVKVNLETFGGKLNTDVLINENGDITLPTPSKEGYTFKYWCSDKQLENKISNLNTKTYNGEKIYAYYEYNSDFLKSEVVVTMFNEHASNYDELAMFDNTQSSFTSLYWHKIAITKQQDKYYVTNIAKSGEKLSALGNYDYVILAYGGYKNYNDFVNMDCYIGYEVNFLIDPITMNKNNNVNVLSFTSEDIPDINLDLKNYLEETYSNYKTVNSNITLVKQYNNNSITWKTSNREIINTNGVYKKPYMTRDVTLSAYLGDDKVYEFTVNVKGETDKSTALSTGYIYTPYNTITQNAMDMLDIIYIAFLEIDNNANFTNLTRVTNNINNYIRDKAEKSGTKIVVSVNQSTSTAFPTVAASQTLREKLANNIVTVIKDLELDGVDIDWETPTSSEATTFTLLMKEIYTKVKKENSDYLVTAAIGGGKWQPPKYDLPNSRQYLDYINLMTYSMTTGNGYYQNSLYPSTKSRTLVSCSIDESIDLYNSYGIPNSQILVGIPFYVTVQANCDGPGSKVGSGKSKWYNLMFTDYKVTSTMKEYFDEECGVPYRYDATTKTFISFDNEESIKVKCEYINTLGLAGIMYWQYGQDVDDMLTNAIKKYINS